MSGQWVQFPSERAFYRYAEWPLRAVVPQVPDRTQFNRLMREHLDATTTFGLYLVELMHTQQCIYVVLDSTAAVTHDAKRHGQGWLASIRQIIETVNDKLLNIFRLGRSRPHDLTGFQARLAAKVRLHNFCIWFNLQLAEPF